MKVRVTWCNINPFVPRIQDLFRGSEAYLPDDMSLETVERYAVEATPKGYFLKEIEFPDYTMEYGYRDPQKRVRKEKEICQSVTK